jgi:hypothetical protein
MTVTGAILLGAAVGSLCITLIAVVTIIVARTRKDVAELHLGVAEVHAAVNSRMDAALLRIDTLARLLQSSGIEIPAIDDPSPTTFQPVPTDEE